MGECPDRAGQPGRDQVPSGEDQGPADLNAFNGKGPKGGWKRKHQPWKGAGKGGDKGRVATTTRAKVKDIRLVCMRPGTGVQQICLRTSVVVGFARDPTLPEAAPRMAEAQTQGQHARALSAQWSCVG